MFSQELCSTGSEPYLDQSGINNLAECTISIEDPDNDLLSGSDEEQEDSDAPIILCRGEIISLTRGQWRAAILAFKESGWDPEGDVDVYSTPGIAVGAEDGMAMQEAGYRLQQMISQNPTLAQSIGLDPRLFPLLTEFVGKGQFSIR